MFSKLLRLPVGVCIPVQLIQVHNYTYTCTKQYTASFSFLKAVSSFTISLSFPNASVLYTYFPCISGILPNSNGMTFLCQIWYKAMFCRVRDTTIIIMINNNIIKQQYTIMHASMHANFHSVPAQESSVVSPPLKTPPYLHYDLCEERHSSHYIHVYDY